MSPASLVTILVHESFRNLLVDCVVEGSGLLDEPKLLSYLEHVGVNRDQASTVHREQSNAVSNLASDAMQLGELFSHSVCWFPAKAGQPCLTAFVRNQLSAFNDVRSPVAEPELA